MFSSKNSKGARADTRTTLQIWPPPSPNAPRDEINRSGEPLTPIYTPIIARQITLSLSLSLLSSISLPPTALGEILSVLCSMLINLLGILLVNSSMDRSLVL